MVRKEFFNNTQHPAYRSDIDGLRAIAVLSVVLFHAFPQWLSGGFIGVDIFFVISGFLISTIIFENLDNYSFSFIGFYYRRARRIFPALCIVLIASCVFGYFTLFDDEYKQLGKHIASGAGFLSNFLLWRESGYFDNASETKPLLHLWSLGIEEDFYLVWPLLLFLVSKNKLNRLTFIAGVTIVSFALNIHAIHDDPIGDFYLPQMRFWELSAGSVLAYFSLQNSNALSLSHRKIDAVLESIIYANPGKQPRQTLYNLQAWLGATFIFSGLFFIKKSFHFPGWLALLPTAGAILIISGHKRAWFNRVILSNRLLVWFGLISYPLYLWHWPLLSFANIIVGIKLTNTMRGGLVCIAILLAWLTYRIVERPIRFGNAPKGKLIIVCIALLITGATGLFIYRHDGLEFRDPLNSFNTKQLTWVNFQTPGCAEHVGFNPAYCTIYGNINNIKVAVIGDSTANVISSGLAEIYANDHDGLINLGSLSCWPVHGAVGIKEGGMPCPDVVDKTYEFLLKNDSIRTVIIVFAMGDVPHIQGMPDFPDNSTFAERFEKLEPLLTQEIDTLRKANKNIIVSYDMPHSGINPKACLDRHLFFAPPEKCEFDESIINNRQPYLDFYNKFFDTRHDVCIFHQYDLLKLPNDKFRLMDDNGRLLTKDEMHLSYFGSEQMALMFKKSKCFNK